MQKNIIYKMRYIKLFEEIGERKIFVTSEYISGDGVDWYYPNELPANIQSSYNRMKYHVGDHVWYCKSKRVIQSVELYCTDRTPYYLQGTSIFNAEWVQSRYLVLIPEYEVDAEKYNL
jgi:hypothetical protein